MKAYARRPSALALADAFTPACMDAEELGLWRAANRAMQDHHATRPCEDCEQPYADAMRALGRCNGTPGEGAP